MLVKMLYKSEAPNKCKMLFIANNKTQLFLGEGEGIKKQQMAPNSERIGKELIIYPSSATLQNHKPTKN